MSIKIVSDGTMYGTNVYDENGKLIKGISKIEIDTIDAAKKSLLVEAKLTFVKVELDIKTNENKIEEVKEGE